MGAEIIVKPWMRKALVAAVVVVAVAGAVVVMLQVTGVWRRSWLRSAPRAGLRLVYRTAEGKAAGAAEVMGRRLERLSIDYAVAARGTSEVVVELGNGDAKELARARALLGRGGRLTFRVVVDGSDAMRRLGERVRTEPERWPGLEVRNDLWMDPTTSAQRQDVLLVGSREALTRALLDLPKAAPELALPADHEVLLEEEVRASDGGTGLPRRFHTVYVRRAADLDGERVADAEVTSDPITGQPQVSITFDPAGAETFATLTASIVGRKLAIALDDEVRSTPVVMSEIRGGRAVITTGGERFADAAAEAEDLVILLASHALPAAMLLEQEETFGR